MMPSIGNFLSATMCAHFLHLSYPMPRLPFFICKDTVHASRYSICSRRDEKEKDKMKGGIVWEKIGGSRAKTSCKDTLLL